MSQISTTIIIFLVLCFLITSANQIQCSLDQEFLHTRIEFVMYYTKAIHQHASYAYMINEEYGTYYNISTILITHNSHHNHQTNSNFSSCYDPSFDKEEDVRWNKVKILYNLLSTTTTEQYDGINTDDDISSSSSSSLPRQVDYWIWLDSDLVFVNFSFNLSNLIQQYSNYDLILSREINPANGIANTGSMIVKNTPWAREFFYQWWYQYDHIAAMDQHALEDLLRSHQFDNDNDDTEINQHVKLLPERAINSAFPGLLTHRDEDCILHLAGESNFIRAAVLKKIWKNLFPGILSASLHIFLKERDLKIPLIRRVDLDSIDYLSIHLDEWKSIIESLQKLLPDATALQELQQIRYRIREAQQSLNKYSMNIIPTFAAANLNKDPDNIQSQQQQITNYTVTSLRSVYSFSTTLLQRHKSKHTTVIVELIQNCLDSGFELAVVESDSEIYPILLKELKLLIDELYSIVPVTNYQYINYYLFKVLEFEAIFAEQHHIIDEAIHSYHRALSIWLETANQYSYYGNGNALLSSYKEGIRTIKHLLCLYCWQQSNVEEKRVGITLDIATIIYQGNCLLFSLLKETRDRVQSDRLAECLMLPPSHDSFLPSQHRTILFHNYSDYSQHEFLELFILSLPCANYHIESRLLNAFQRWKKYLFQEDQIMFQKLLNLSLDKQSLSYFDILTKSMIEFTLTANIKRLSSQPTALSASPPTHTQKQKKFKRKKKEL